MSILIDNHLIAGVDEVGRGPLVGPVVAAAVILDPSNPIIGLKDSKKLSEKKRNSLCKEIKLKAKAYAVSYATHEEIDDINILQASLLAMRRAIIKLKILPTMALIDGNKAPDLDIPYECIIKGDSKYACISAASILAKVVRDDWMYKLDQRYPNYGFAKHKGYPTVTHMQALNLHGVCHYHRKSFKPVARVLEQNVV